MFRIFKELRWFFKKEWYKYILVLLFTILFTYAITIPPKYIGIIIDSVAPYNTLTVDYAIEIGVIMVVVGFVIYSLTVLKNRFLGGLFHRLFYKIKIKFMEAIFLQDGDFFEEYYSGDLITRATGDANLIATISTNTLFNFIDTMTMLVVAFVSMISLSAELTLYSIMPLPIILLIVLYLRPKIMQNWKLVRGEVSHLNNLVMESVTHAKLIRGFVRENDDEEKLSNKADLVYKTERKSVLMQAVIPPSFRMVTTIAQGIALAYGAYLVIHQKNFTVGNLVSFNLYLGMFARPLFRLGNQITQLSQSSVSFDRVNEILNATPSIPDQPYQKKLEKIKTIEYRNLSFRFPKDKENTIFDINLKINQGETIGIVGKTGSGKTTLIRQLLRQFEITEGSLLINGNHINRYKKDSIREAIAYVPQEHALFSRTVFDNLELGKSTTTDISVEEAVKMADFEKDLPALSDGINTIVGEAGVTLSGGQKQRLSIARAFLKNADILVMDDSLSAVDGMTEANILKNLKAYRNGKTNIITSHRLSVVERADLIIVMDKGRIVERGTHDELMENRNWYYQQYIAQQMEALDEKKAD